MSERKVMSVIALVGSAERVGVELARLKRDFQEKHGEFAIEIINTEEAETGSLINAVSSMPFLVSEKMVIARDLSHSGLKEEFDRALEITTDAVTLVVAETNVDKRSTFFKTLRDHTAYKDLSSLAGQELVRYVQDVAHESGLDIKHSQAQYLINLIGENEMALKNEILKLAAVGSADKGTIDTVTEKGINSKVFDVLEAALNKKITRAEELYDEQRSQRVEPQAMLGLIVWQLQVLALAKTATNIEETAKAARMSSYPIRQARAISVKLPYTRLVELVHSAAETDLAIKNGANPDQALKTLIADISS